MPKNKKSLSEKIVTILGGKDATAAELGLLGIEQLYSLLGMPFAQGGAVGSPPVYQTNEPKEAVKEIVRRTPFLSGAPDMFPIYADENSRINFNVGRPGLDDFQIGFSGRGKYFGDIGVGLGDQGIGAYHSAQTPIPGVTSQISYDENRGPRLDLMYQKRFADGGRAGYIRGGPVVPSAIRNQLNRELREKQKKQEEIENKTSRDSLMRGRREQIIPALKSANVISDKDVSRILEQYGLMSLAEGGIASGPPPERGPMPQGLETLFQKR